MNQQFPLWIFELGFLGFLGLRRIDLEGFSRIILPNQSFLIL
jgi:hypothetical protein